MIPSEHWQTFAHLYTFKSVLTGLGVKWKLERASNLRKSVSISFWISTCAGLSSSSVLCWSKKTFVHVLRFHEKSCKIGILENRPDSAWGILAHKSVLDSVCSSHGPKSAFSCIQKLPLWVSLCGPHRQKPVTQVKSALLLPQKQRWP